MWDACGGMVRHHSPEEDAALDLAKILRNTRTDELVRSRSPVVGLVAAAPASSTTAATHGLTRPHHHPLLITAPVLHRELSWVLGKREEDKPLTFNSGDPMLGGHGKLVVDFLKTLAASDPSMMSTGMQISTARGCYRITKGRTAYDTSRDESDPMPEMFMKRMVNHKVQGQKGDQRMGIMTWWTHAGVPCRKAACDGSAKRCGIRCVCVKS